MTNSGTSSSLLDEHSTIYRTDLATGHTQAAMTWPLDDGAPPAMDAAVEESQAIVESLGAGNVVDHDGHLFFLDDESSESEKSGDPVQVAPGMGSYTRLVALDPATGTHRSTLLYPFADLYDTAYTPAASGARMATRQGYAYNGSIYRVNAEGQIMAVNLDTKKFHNVGPVSPTLRGGGAYGVVAAGNGNLLTFMFHLEGGATRIETYSLDTGKLVRTLPVTGLEGLFEHGVSLDSIGILAYD